MAEFKITRFRYTWRGNWAGDSTTYYKDDVVFYAGSSWVCVRQHTSDIFDDAQTFIPPGNTLPVPAWVKMTDGRKWLGEWTTGTRYDPGVVVQAGGNLYLCIASHVGSFNFSQDLANWEVLATGSNFRNTWSTGTRYRVGDIVRYNGYTYQCVLEHSSGSITQGVEVGNNDSQDDSTAETWSVLVENYTYVGEHQSSTRYRKNDLVKYGATILKCIVEHTSVNFAGQIDNEKFVTYLPGFEFDNQWNNVHRYAIGDVVRYGGVLYVAAQYNTNSQPGISALFENGNPNWTIVHKGIDFKGAYDPDAMTVYKEGDVVRRGGALWVSLTNQTTDDSTLAPLDPSNWEIVIAAQNFRGSWTVNQDYNLYDVVYYRGVVYYAHTPHVSDFQNWPGDNGSGFNLWTIVTIGDESAALQIFGDLLTYNLRRYEIFSEGESFVVGDESTFGPVNIPAGDSDQLLMVENNQGDISYATWGNLQRIFFVSLNGVDDDTDPDRGINYFKPYRTVRFALEKADDGFEGTTSIKVYAGEYQEILPLIVPPRTAIIGEELRSVTIRASEPIAALANDAEYTLETLVWIGTLLPDITQGIPVSPTLGNDQVQNTTQAATNIESAIVDELWTDIVDSINARVNDIGTVPAVTGHNTPTTNPGRLLVIDILENNREFIKAEAIAYMQVNNPQYSFDTIACRRDIDRFISAVQYDIEYPGNYKTLLAARYYSNAIIGSALEDMFYVRDTTGIRNCTLKGLNGTLPELQEGQVYRIPTGGAFVSLDPGWGPDDERVWILNRSCYVQNVTTFGTGATGQKIDGLLHNGGNKSIVSNDFTQVISDGIGAWVQNGGRAELVSVFTYYCHIGMFTKDGGIIRATNGNSSYGDFGAVADGIDPDEDVRLGSLNTQTGQAIIASAFAGEILDFILGLEFINCGQNYTTATYSITSSGTGAQAIQEEFRDNSMFECQVTYSGAGFTQYGNQAQLGGTTSIILATSETATEAQILGMRIIIISGEGTGQYGYVQSYNSVTKTCLVYRESDGQPGWDHILPGTPSNPLLTTGTRYRIEPRPAFSDPIYEATEITLSQSYEWAAAVYGETTDQFTNVVGTLGTGVTNEVVPAPAEFTVNKIGRTYTASITDPGAGYAVNDLITLDGADIGGVSGEHDLIIKVTDVSDDSTNSIISFTIGDITPIANSGKFIITPSSGDIGRYSEDGASWTTFTLPSAGNWKCLAAGENKFVAIRSGTAVAAISDNGVDWTAELLPGTRDWNAMVYGKPSTVSDGIFLAVAGNLNTAIYSSDGGLNWSSSILPTFGDSTFNEYVDIAFGREVFVALANTGNIAAVGTWNGTTLTWQGTIMDVVDDSSSKDWVSIAYGNRRFVAISSTGDVGYSFDGLVWYPATMPKQDGSTAHGWRQIRYGQGVFFAVGDTGGRIVGADPTAGPTTYSATSYDGIVWTPRELATNATWGILAFGNPDITLGDSTLSNNKPTWIAAPTGGSDKLNKIYTGAKALGRIVVEGSGVSYIKLWEPGSGYHTDPTLTVTDPSKTEDPIIRPRLADGVLAQPTFTEKGVSYKTSTTTVTVTGDGFADVTPTNRFITVDGLDVMPGPGAQFYIGGKTTYYTAVIVGIDETLDPNGKIRSTFQISPRPTLSDFLEHGMEVLIRERYSQVRITGHDFLDVGTGNFDETNYPQLYTDYEFETQPFQEVQNLNGGRVFYTSTDQDGNFRAGELFAVEQATGIITISADFFDLEGLTELRLAGINVGSTAIIREFSKDPLFLQNSNNIIPTQRAIRSYLQSRLNVGGEDLLTPSIIAGTVKVGPNLIDTTAGLTIDFKVMADFLGNQAGLSGSFLANAMFYRGFK